MSEWNLSLSAAYDAMTEPVACFEDGKLVYENPMHENLCPSLYGDDLKLVLEEDSGTVQGWHFHRWTHGSLSIVRFFHGNDTPLVSDERMTLLTGRLRGYVAKTATVQEQLEERMNIFQENDLMPLFAILNQSRLRSLRLLSNLELAALADGEKPAMYTPAPVDLNGLIQEIGLQLTFLLRHVDWTLEVQDKGHTLYALCDDILLQIQLFHLISNAVHSNPQHPGHLILRLEQRGNQAFITVMDDGVGMTATQIATYLDPGQPRETVSDLLRGVSTGLIASHKIARLHGGTLLLANRPEGGLRASISLPLTREKPENCSAHRFMHATNGVALIMREMSTVLPSKCFYSCDL